MTPDQYVDILKRHGRRVANRAAFVDQGAARGTLGDFFACYAPEDDLPAHERCRTGLIKAFDPAGWFLRYSNPDYSTHPEPVLGATVPGIASTDTDQPPPPPTNVYDDAKAAAALAREVDRLFEAFMTNSAQDATAAINASAATLLASGVFESDTVHQHIVAWLVDGIKAHP